MINAFVQCATIDFVRPMSTVRELGGIMKNSPLLFVLVPGLTAAFSSTLLHSGGRDIIVVLYRNSIVHTVTLCVLYEQIFERTRFSLIVNSENSWAGLVPRRV